MVDPIAESVADNDECSTESVPPPPSLSAICQVMEGLELFTSELRRKAFPPKPKLRKIQKPTKVPSIEEMLVKIQNQEKELRDMNTQGDAKPSRPPKKPSLPKPYASSGLGVPGGDRGQGGAGDRVAPPRSEAQSQAACRVRELKRRLERSAMKDTDEREQLNARQKELNSQVEHFQQLTKERVAERLALQKKSEQKEDRSADSVEIELRRRESAHRVAVRKKVTLVKLREQVHEQLEIQQAKENENLQKSEELQRRTKLRIQDRVERVKKQQKAETVEAMQRKQQQRERVLISQQEAQRAQEIASQRVKEVLEEQMISEMKRIRESEVEEEEQFAHEQEMIARYGTKGGGVLASKSRVSRSLPPEKTKGRTPKIAILSQKVALAQDEVASGEIKEIQVNALPRRKMSTYGMGSNASTPRIAFAVTGTQPRDADDHPPDGTRDGQPIGTEGGKPRTPRAAKVCHATVGNVTAHNKVHGDNSVQHGLFPDISSRLSTPSVASVSMTSNIYTYSNIHMGACRSRGASLPPTPSVASGRAFSNAGLEPKYGLHHSGMQRVTHSNAGDRLPTCRGDVDECGGNSRPPRQIKRNNDKKAVWKQALIATPSADYYLAQLKTRQHGPRLSANSKRHLTVCTELR
eukprot:GEMP01037310.1.p1 GENE.GEMP01037310.1~~GEMP01037310.1.p1  ORF type:complete len:653 (+),score=159.50 GEMP01037310.1:51-1961(+)